jgi:Na+-translocating ferredoxin:NAD+ oxidoreductase RnfC subunit
MCCLDDLCVWKKMELDSQSSTFEIVKQELADGKSHPLKMCVECDGYNYSCKSYVLLERYLR